MPAIAEAHYNPEDDTVTATTIPCCVCGKVHSFRLDGRRYESWMAGEHIQNVFPELSVVDREILISGTCGECFDSLFPPEE